jgi:hypothetical protein
VGIVKIILKEINNQGIVYRLKLSIDRSKCFFNSTYFDTLCDDKKKLLKIKEPACPGILKTKNQPMLEDTVEMGENQMGPKVLGRYCKNGETLKYK